MYAKTCGSISGPITESTSSWNIAGALVKQRAFFLNEINHDQEPKMPFSRDYSFPREYLRNLFEYQGSKYILCPNGRKKSHCMLVR